MFARRCIVALSALSLGSVAPVSPSKERTSKTITNRFFPSFNTASCEQHTRTPQKLVICCDGTWDKPYKSKGARVSNIVRIARALEPRGPNGEAQIVYYHWGLGSRARLWIERQIEGIWGLGMDQAIVDCYRFILLNYEEGDEIYLFGFSRGAFTVLSLSIFLDVVGILPKQLIHENVTWEAFQAFKGRDDDAIEAFRDKYECMDGNVEFLGLFDTVKAVGFYNSAFRFLTRQNDQYYGHHIRENVQRAAHAVSIDENRRPYVPTLQKESGKGKQCTEVWVPGRHADVGGGFEQNDLANYICRWMINQASGLSFNQEYVDEFVPKARVDKLIVNENRGILAQKFLTKWRYVPESANVHEVVIEKLEAKDGQPYGEVCNPNLVEAKQVKDKDLDKTIVEEKKKCRGGLLQSVKKMFGF